MDETPNNNPEARSQAMTSTTETLAAYNARVPILRKAFEAVERSDDWKAPIDAELAGETVEALGGVEVILEAIAFFTATPTRVSYRRGGAVRFRSAGYRNGPAGP